MAAVQDEFAALVVDGGAQADDAGGAVRGEFVDFEGGVDGVAGVARGEEAAGLFEEGLERVFHHVGEEAGAGGGLDGDLVAVREEVGVAVAAAVFAVVVDGWLSPEAAWKARKMASVMVRLGRGKRSPRAKSSNQRWVGMTRCWVGSKGWVMGG